MAGIIPKQTSDKIAFCFMMVLIHIIVTFEIVVILPYIDSDNKSVFWFHFLIGAFLYINIMSGIWKTISSDPTSGSAVLPSVLKPGWRFCSACEANAPPRSFHCWLCEHCILKRDHHCAFTGNCIGHGNHRYYMTLVLHLSIAAIYCNYLNMDYTWEVLGSFTLKSLFTMFLPLMAYLFGLAGSFTFAVAFVSSMCVLGCILLVALCSYHFINIFNGQTTSERTKRIKEFNMGFVGNMRETFGNRWAIAWISPWISSPLPGDGIHFARNNTFENMKDM